MTSREFVLKMAKGYRGRSKNCFSIAKEKVERGMLNQYKSRRLRKRNMRALWIQQINASARLHDTSYSRLQFGLTAENILLDRKILATLATFEPDSFAAVATLAKDTWVAEQGRYFNIGDAAASKPVVGTPSRAAIPSEIVTEVLDAESRVSAGRVVSADV